MNDPFHSTTLNDILKPIIAADKLKVLRRVNQSFAILLYESDLKTNLSKEKRIELMKGIPSEERQVLSESTEPNKKRKKKRGTLTSARSSYNS